MLWLRILLLDTKQRMVFFFSLFVIDIAIIEGIRWIFIIFYDASDLVLEDE